MVLAITNEWEKLVYEVCKENGFEDVQVFTGIKNFNTFALRELRSLNNYKYIIIDVTSTKETEDEIIKAVVAIKSMYNVRIIIMALGFEEGNSLLSRLFNESIHNFVIGDEYQKQVDEFKSCLSVEGNSYKDSIRFRNEIVTTTNKNKVIIKKEYTKLKQCINIGIAGTEHHIGVTTQALLLCSFFNSLNLKACYISFDNKNDVDFIEELCSVNKSIENIITCEGIDIYRKSNNVDAVKQGYDFYIYDFGLFNEDEIDNFISKDIKIIVGGSKVWEFDSLFNIFDKLSKLDDLHFLINFTAKEKQKEFMLNMNKYSETTYFTDYTPDPFSKDANLDTYHKIFKDYITEKSSKLIVADNKKSIFNLFKRREK